MNNPLLLNYSLNNDYIPASAQSRLVYALVATQVGDLRTVPVPVVLDLVVDASASMRIPLLTEEQFEAAKKALLSRWLT